MLVLCATLNAGASFAVSYEQCSGKANLKLVNQSPSHFEPWLRPQPEHWPDIVAVGFQESLPLPLALLGTSRPALSTQVSKCLSEGNYRLLASPKMGGIQLLLYARASLLKTHQTRLSHANVGCGPLFMANKGAVAVQLHLFNASESRHLVFVTAHLAAHMQNTARRNLDWENAVRRLVFDDGRQIYQADQLFV
jgi:hypothetical protein